jgi:hypothetical protein
MGITVLPSLAHASAIDASFDTRMLALGLAKGNGHILVLVHVQQLSLHGHEEQYKKVQEQYWPKDGHVKERKERHDHGRADATRRSEPKFEFGQASGKGSKFLTLLGRRGQCWTVIVTAIA